jgi:hypothetical protein
MLAELILWAAMVGKEYADHRYSSDPNRRMQELMYESDTMGQPLGEVKRFWMNDQPSHLTPDRTHGGVR